MDKVSDYDPELDRNALGDPQAGDIATGVRFELDGDEVRLVLEERLAACVKSLQVFDGPVELGLGTGKP